MPESEIVTQRQPPPRTTALATLNPQALIAQAIERGMDVESLKQLVDLGKDMLALQAKQAYDEAMAAFHRDCPPIYKTATGQVGNAKTRYAPLDEIMDKVRPVLGANGLSASWRSPRSEPGHVVRVCRISHALGHFEESGEIVIPIGGQEDRSAATPAQRVGIAIAYADRYSVKDILGLAPEPGDDRDGGAGQTGEAGQRQSGQPSGGSPARGGDPDAVITENQGKRLHAIASGQKWTQEHLHELLSGYQYNSSREVKVKDYDEICDVDLKGGYTAWKEKVAKRAAAVSAA